MTTDVVDPRLLGAGRAGKPERPALLCIACRMLACREHGGGRGLIRAAGLVALFFFPGVGVGDDEVVEGEGACCFFGGD